MTSTQQRAVIVLGMHRSGTSVLTKGVSALGVAIGSKGNLLESNRWNAKGYFEHAGIVSLNDALLQRVGKRWDSLAMPDWVHLWPVCQPYEAQAQSFLKDHFADDALIGIKDPRACRLLPFWQSVFQRSGIADSYVIALRNPVSIARSLAARNGFRAEKSYQLWLSHMVAAIRDTTGKPRVVVDYDLLVESPLAQLERIAKALSLPDSDAIRLNSEVYAREFVSREMRHSIDDAFSVHDDPRAGDLVARAYELLHRMARDDFASPSDARILQHEWHVIEQRLEDDMALLSYVDECEDRIDVLTIDTAGAEEPARVEPTVCHSIMPEVDNSAMPIGTSASPAARVSVVIPLYNHAKFIRTTLNSVLEQTLPPVEIIVVDDGSSDESAAIVAEFCARHPEIVFWTWPNQGAHRALNAGIQRATGEFVAILNSDDVYAPSRLAECLAAMQCDPEAEAVTTAITFIDDAGAPWNNPWYARARAAFSEEGELALGLLHANFLVSTSNLFVRRSLFDAIGNFAPLRYAHDLEFFMRLLLAGRKIHFLDRPLLAYRMHAGNTIAENQARADVESAAVFAFFLYRKRLSGEDNSGWRAWLERYVEIIGRKQLLELVEHFLASIQERQLHGNPSLNEEFHRLLALLSDGWTRHRVEDSPLAELVAARNGLLRRNRRIEQAERARQFLQLTEMTEGKAWLEAQWKASQAELAEIAKGKAWLEAQWKASQAELAEIAKDKAWLEAQWKASQAELAEIAKGKAWLEAQWKASQAELKATETRLDEAAQEKECLEVTLRDAQVELAELFEGKKWLESQWKGAQAEIARRDRQLVQLRDEADALFKRLEQLLKSRSWQLTRPLRAAARIVRHGHPVAAGDRTLYHVAAKIGRTFPFPLWMKARVRAALIKRAYPTPLPALDAGQATGRAPLAVPDGHDGALVSMRPECCGLVEGLVSIVLPVYNQAYLLAESIDSVLSQTYQDFELIVINDGSTDGVEAVLDRYLDHPKVRCYTQANQRLPKALSNGFDHARGEFWTWTSADNIMQPRMLEKLVARLRDEPATGMTYADYYAIDDRGALLQDRAWRAHNRPDPASGEIRLPRATDALNTVQDNFIGPCFMYRGWIGRCLGDYDPQLGVEDYDYWMRINAFFELRHLGSDELLYRYRVHDNTLSAQANEHRIHEKVQRLMDYEDERARFYRTAPTLMADAHGLDWLISSGVDAGSIRTLTDENGTLRLDDAGKVELLFITSETAARYLSVLAMLPTPTAIIFSQDDLLYQKLQRLLKRTGCLALVPSRLVADRVRLVGTCPVVDISANLSFVAALAFAKNHLFFQATRTPTELERHLPRQLLKPAGQHVLLQVDSFIQGGMENVVIDLALSLQDTGFEVTIGILGKSGDAADKARDRKLRVESLPRGLSPEDYVAWLKSQRVSLVNAHYSIFGAAACKREGIPFIETIHNSYVWLDPESIRQYREADAHITSYICVSNTAAQYADVVLGLDVSKMRVVPNGIDAGNIDANHFDSNRNGLRQEWQVGPDTTVFLNVASVMATKAQLPLVKAFAQVVKQHPDVRLVLLGSVMEKPYQRAIGQAIEDLKLQKQVIFAGYHRDVARYYHAADVFVLPSYWEGWSLSLGEAMANGLSCVITDVGSAYEFEGYDNVEIVSPPFGDITLLNYLNLGDFVYAEDENFERVLGEAMCKQIGRDRKACNMPLAAQLDRARAYEDYARIYSRYFY